MRIQEVTDNPRAGRIDLKKSLACWRLGESPTLPAVPEGSRQYASNVNQRIGLAVWSVAREPGRRKSVARQSGSFFRSLHSVELRRPRIPGLPRSHPVHETVHHGNIKTVRFCIKLVISRVRSRRPMHSELISSMTGFLKFASSTMCVRSCGRSEEPHRKKHSTPSVSRMVVHLPISRLAPSVPRMRGDTKTARLGYCSTAYSVNRFAIAQSELSNR